jgi:hypothetical protein
MILDSQSFRRSMVENLRKDILGPSIDSNGFPVTDELLYLAGKAIPTTRYITGYLSPKEWGDSEEDIERMAPLLNSKFEGSLESENESKEGFGENTNEKDIDDDLHFIDDEASGFSLKNPSSMGISFVLVEDLDQVIKVNFSWGEYRYQEDSKGWQRLDFKKSISITLKEVLDANQDNIWDTRINSNIFEEIDQVYATIQIEKVRDSSNYFIIVRFVNGREAAKKDVIKNSEKTLFQSKITVSGVDFQDTKRTIADTEDRDIELLYHDSKVIARGHNVSVDWSEDLKEIMTSWIPSFEVKRFEENELLKSYIPTMLELSSKEDFSQALESITILLNEYESWSDDLESWRSNEGLFINEKLLEKLDDNIKVIRINIQRMKKGINILSNDKDAAKAFRYANEAIFLSQKCPAVGRDNFNWKPFQLSFILLNISGLLYKSEGFDAKDRDIIDLAWFPTGGGKTEAYLGLVAIIGFYRTLSKEDDFQSVHAIMRYTLRLLTLNQAERATRLMVAMNIVSEKYSLNAKEFFVGMWVGAAASPNTLKKAEKIRDEIYISNKPPSNGITPILLDNCPWCGHQEKEIKDRANLWKYDKQKKTFRGKCSNNSCILSERKIPFSCIDEELYHSPPTLLIATVDKFAQLASKPESRVLLGLKTGGKRRTPPDLIIQDELHLLTGPLGSMAGLYESMLEIIWNNVQFRPKYVAATATIRGIEKDAELMFGRKLNVFPPPGRSIKDNFFSQEDNSNAGRQHLAILGNPSINRTVLNQPLANLLQQVHHYSELYPDLKSQESIEPYHTCMVYFNSLRELSGATTALEDSVKSLIEYFAQEYNSSSARTNIKSEELYSRKRSEELKRTLDNLKIKSKDAGCLDTCFTTNMFQVGVDVDRLGLMLINGQPKSNSEYIQASGRVGREKKWPGVVISILRSAKPRDLSHYEMHRHFHQEMYRYVDVTTTTPFSPRAFDHALPSIIMLLCRQIIEECGQNDKIGILGQPHQKTRVEKIRDDLLKLVSERLPTSSSIKVDVEDRIVRQFRLLLNTAEEQKNNSNFYWRAIRNNTEGWCAGYDSSLDLDPHRKVNLNVLDSLRSVSDEVWFADNRKPSEVFGRTPISQIFSYALPGGLWDYEGDTYMTMGINNWPITEDMKYELQIQESVLESILPDNQKLFQLPTQRGHGNITVTQFPWIYRCNGNPSHLVKWPIIGSDKEKRCSYKDCNEKVRQVRFVSLCSEGHLQAFDWNFWVQHKENCSYKRIDKNSTLHHLKVELNPGYQHDLDSWNVICKCGGSRTLRGVTSSKQNNKLCNGFRPWLGNDSNEEIEESHRLSNRQRGSSSIALPSKSSVLLIHPTVNISILGDPLIKSWIQLVNVDMITPDLEGQFYHNLKKERPDLQYTFDELKYEIENYINTPDKPTRGNLRQKELRGIAHGSSTIVNPKDGLFSAETILGGDVDFEDTWFATSDSPIKHITKLDRLTELQYIDGLTRLKHEKVQKISTDEWLIGNYNYGEGIYLGLAPSWIEKHAQKRVEKLENSSILFEKMVEDIGMRSLSREIDLENPDTVFCLPILHTFSHIIIKQICKESGYSLGSIRERLYLEADDKGKIIKTGILLYTTGASSDGTLGGLSSLASKGNNGIMERIIKSSLENINICSNDPICSENRPNRENSNGSACHACVLLPETCCELGNFALDRRWY